MALPEYFKTIMHRIKALIKRIKSYSKKNWMFEDYPIRIWKNMNASEDKVAYGAGIINWSLMVGHGNTSEKALEALKESFKNYKDNNEDIPRPGTKVPIMFAQTNNIDIYERMAVDFFKNILGMDYHEGFYSDGSSLEHFEPYDNNEVAKETREKIIKKTLLLYNVDISDIYDEPLWIILEKINMKSQNWNFTDAPNVAVITTKRIILKQSDIIFVSHDFDDGMWQFIDEYDNDENTSAIVGLEEIVNIDPTISQLSDLPLGWIATRKSKLEDWKKEKHE